MSESSVREKRKEITASDKVGKDVCTNTDSSNKKIKNYFNDFIHTKVKVIENYKKMIKMYENLFNDSLKNEIKALKDLKPTISHMSKATNEDLNEIDELCDKQISDFKKQRKVFNECLPIYCSVCSVSHKNIHGTKLPCSHVLCLPCINKLQAIMTFVSYDNENYYIYFHTLCPSCRIPFNKTIITEYINISKNSLTDKIIDNILDCRLKSNSISNTSTYCPTSPTYNPGSPTYSPTSPTYNPGAPTYSPTTFNLNLPPSSPAYQTPPPSPPLFSSTSS